MSGGVFQFGSYGYEQSPLEQVNYMAAQDTSALEASLAELSKTTHSFIQKTRASIQNLEVQIGQLSKQNAERPPSTFSSDTIPNSRKKYKTIYVMSEKEMETQPSREEEPSWRKHERSQRLWGVYSLSPCTYHD
ncbi:hypothetical protein AHAS_Ahas11G0251500 [Arachis hypogaea]